MLVVVGGCSARSPVAPLAAAQAPAVASTVEPEPVDPTAEPNTPAVAPTATPTPGPTPTPTPEPIPLGLITPTGVTVAVIGVDAHAFAVRTPCGRLDVVTAGTRLGTVSVVIDPGHGGPIDTGAVGPGGLVERDLNLRLARSVEADLGARGISVSLTRTADYATTLATRSSYADGLAADILVSIHHNAPQADPSTTPGTEVFVQTGSDDSHRLGGLLYEEVTAALNQFDVAWATAPDAGVLEVHAPEGHDAYGMIRRPQTPTALIELGYIANPAEESLFLTDTYLAVASAALGDAIEAFLETDREGTGHGNPARVFAPSAAPGIDVCVDPILE